MFTSNNIKSKYKLKIWSIFTYDINILSRVNI
jgi:hypothetical protein